MNQQVDFASLSDEEIKKLYAEEKTSQAQPKNLSQISNEDLVRKYQQEKTVGTQTGRHLAQGYVDVFSSAASAPGMIAQAPGFLSDVIDIATKKIQNLVSGPTEEEDLYQPGKYVKSFIPEVVKEGFQKAVETLPTAEGTRETILSQILDPDSALSYISGRKAIEKLSGKEIFTPEAKENIRNLLTPKTEGEKRQQRVLNFGVPGLVLGGLGPAVAGMGLGAIDFELEKAGVSDDDRKLVSAVLLPLLERSSAKVKGAVKEVAKTVPPEGIPPGGGPPGIGPGNGGFPTIETAKKPSGLPIRRFEKVTEPRKISAKQKEQISSKLEDDFKKISDKIIEESPISKTKSAVEANPAYGSELSDKFKEVETLAANIDGTLSTDVIKRNVADKFLKKKGTGFLPSEYDKDFIKFGQQFLKETPSQEITALDIVKQYRKNNKALGEAYDPSRPYAFNRAKKDAILEYNRGLAETIKTEYPKSEFANLFETTNKQWSEYMDVIAMDEFHEGLFKGDINYKEAVKFFDNAKLSRPFKRALGEAGYKQYQQLMKDLLSTKKPFQMLKHAEKMGWLDLGKMALPYLINPKLGTAVTLGKVGYGLWNAARNALLDKKQLAFTWRKAVNDLNHGRFKQAEAGFSRLDKGVKDWQKSSKVEELSRPEQKRLEAPKKQIELKASEEKLPPTVPEKKPAPVVEKPKPKETPKPAEVKAPKSEEKPSLYTIEDFPTIKEARDYLDYQEKRISEVKAGNRPPTHAPNPNDVSKVKEILEKHKEKIKEPKKVAKPEPVKVEKDKTPKNDNRPSYITSRYYHTLAEAKTHLKELEGYDERVKEGKTHQSLAPNPNDITRIKEVIEEFKSKPLRTSKFNEQKVEVFVEPPEPQEIHTNIPRPKKAPVNRMERSTDGSNYRYEAKNMGLVYDNLISIAGKKGDWIVSHQPSGLRLFSFKTQAKAIEFVKGIYDEGAINIEEAFKSFSDEMNISQPFDVDKVVRLKNKILRKKS